MSELRPLELPRGLIFLGSLWLIGSWLVAIGLHSPLQPVSASYTPGVRMMIYCLVIGLVVGWPLLRLSQEATASPIRQTLLDAIALTALIQIVIWPLRLVTPWSPLRTAALDATLVAWALIAAAFVASAAGSRSAAPRCLAIAGCVGLCVLGPFAAWAATTIGVRADDLQSVNPLTNVAQLTDAGGDKPTAMQWLNILMVAMAAALAWGAVLVTTSVRRDRV